MRHCVTSLKSCKFLSIQAQDFIEDSRQVSYGYVTVTFLSIQAQDFIEDVCRVGLERRRCYS